MTFDLAAVAVNIEPPEALDDEPYPSDWRWFCTQCGRFLAEDAVRQWDERDPDAYYGITAHIEADCAKCGSCDPAWKPTRWRYPT
jgi:hypothetical protein